MLPLRPALLLLLLGLTLTACRADVQPAQAPAAAAVPVRADAPAAPDLADLPEASLYVLDAPWTDQEGQTVRLASFRGRPVLMAMIFTHCGFACPTIVREMKQVTAGLSEAEQARVRYVLVSMDPERDTPEVLARYARAHGLDPAQWTLLRGDAQHVRVLANLLDVTYRREADGQFSHANLITLLDAEGTVVRRQEGLGTAPDETTAALRTLLAAR